MTQEQPLSALSAFDHVDDLFSRFGVRTTLKAMLVVAWRRHQTKVHVSHLSDYMRRDVGLPVHKPMFREPLIPPWFPRL